MTSLARPMGVFRAIRDRILALEPDLDEQTLADTLEGLTDLNEAIAAVVRSALVEEAYAEGLKSHISRLQERLQRLIHRAEVRRQVARDAMVEADLRTLRAPDFTLSVRPGGPGLVVTDEQAIPSTYWQPREPRLDRLGLLRDLKQGATVEGASLSNSAPVLSVRVR